MKKKEEKTKKSYVSVSRLQYGRNHTVVESSRGYMYSEKRLTLRKIPEREGEREPINSERAIRTRLG